MEETEQFTMSLYEKADGILETHVTWHDVEADLQKNLGTKARFGENKKATNISERKRFMSRIALIHPDWVGVEEGKRLPERFIVKMCSQIPMFTLSKMMKYEGDDGFAIEKMQRMTEMTRGCHNREVAAYRLLDRFNHPDVPFTKVYSLKPFEGDDDLKGYIVADFIPNIVDTIHTFRIITADELESTIRAVATFAALGEKIPTEEKKFAGGTEYLETMFEQFLDSSSLEKSFENLRKAFSDEYREKVDKLIEIYWHYQSLVRKFSRISELLGFKLVLNHGDLWQSNLMFSVDDDNKLRLKALIDWQGISLMPPGLDMSRLLIGCLSVQDYRERKTGLLKLYFDTFTTTFGRELFSFQELQDSYFLYLPTMSMIILPGMMPFLDQAQIPEPLKMEIRTKAMEKMIGILEEVLEAHEYNRKRYAEFLEL